MSGLTDDDAKAYADTRRANFKTETDWLAVAKQLAEALENFAAFHFFSRNMQPDEVLSIGRWLKNAPFPDFDAMVKLSAADFERAHAAHEAYRAALGGKT